MKLDIIYNEDCLEGMKRLLNRSIDLVLTDPPYGTTACKWDKIIPLEPMWEQLKRVIKPNGAIVMTANQPFTSELVCSNKKNFRYSMVWEKEQATNFMFLKKQIGKIHEDILVWYKKQPTYNPQMIYVGKPTTTGSKNKINSHNLTGGEAKREGSKNRYPTSIVKYNRDRNKLHPTQKPVALMKYLIKTYTNEGETVLDFAIGSGTTAVACINLNRHYIGFEINPEYCEITKRRLAEIQLELIKQGGNDVQQRADKIN